MQSDQASVDALRCFIDDLGAERAFLFQDGEGQGDGILLLDTGVANAVLPALTDADRVRSERRSPLFDWASAGRRAVEAAGERVLRLPLSVGDQRLTMLVVFASADDCQRSFVEKAVRRLKPFLQICLNLWRKNNADLAQRRTIEAAMHLSGLAVLVLGTDEKLLFANRKAQDLLDRADGIRRNGVSISATSLADALRLQVAIAHEAGQDRASSPILTLARAHSARPLIVAVSSCRDEGGIAGDAPLTVLHVLDPEVETRSLIEPICDLYHLSRMERALAVELVDGSSLSEAATRLKLKTQTARSYLKQIFIKTATNRQADLVRLLLVSAIRLAAPRLTPLPAATY